MIDPNITKDHLPTKGTGRIKHMGFLSIPKGNRNVCTNRRTGNRPCVGIQTGRNVYCNHRRTGTIDLLHQITIGSFQRTGQANTESSTPYHIICIKPGFRNKGTAHIF